MIGQIVFPAHLPVTDCGVPLLSRRLRTVLFILPVVLVGMLSLLVHAPGERVLRWLQPSLPVQAVSGSLATGEAILQLRQQGWHVAWDWQPARLLLLGLGVEARVQGPLQADAAYQRGPLSWRLALSGVSIPAGPAEWLGPGAVLPGWQGDALVFSRRHGGAWRGGEGELRTAGGPFRLDMQGQVQALVLPPALWRWRVVDGNLVGELSQRAGNGALATVTLTADNRIQWQLRERLLQLKPGYAGRNNPDLVVLTVSEPLR